MRTFDYIIDKINATELSKKPFKHLHIESLFNEDHFKEIITAGQINLPAFKDSASLIEGLESAGYQIIPFPGTTTDKNKYLAWYENKDKEKHSNANTCEGFGITFRLKKVNEDILTDIDEFFRSDKLIEAVCDKFKLDKVTQTVDGGIQKYLDGYEISPHPDIRKKSLTWMINIHPMKKSEDINIHTDYLVFKDKFAYVQKFWEFNSDYDRCWVPWEWTDVITSQKNNNSMVMFSPSNDTLHAVKLNYNHLTGQRTQIYGNLWSTSEKKFHSYGWEDLTVRIQPEAPAPQPQPAPSGLKALIPQSVKDRIKKMIK